MKKALLLITSRIEQPDELERLIESFEAQDYDVHMFTDDGLTLRIADLPAIVNHVRAHYDDQLTRLVVMSNLRNYVLIWYRAYNTLADDYIYYMDNNQLAGHMDNDFHRRGLYDTLLNYRNIRVEPVEGHIYINLGATNYGCIMPFMLSTDSQAIFKPLEHFLVGSSLQVGTKRRVGKVYELNRAEYRFDEGMPTSEKIAISYEKFNLEIKVVDFLERLTRFPEYSLFSLLTIAEYLKNDIPQIKGMFEQMDAWDDQRKEELYIQFRDYFETTNAGFDVRSFYYTLFVRAGLKKYLLKDMMTTMIEDTRFIPNHYPLLMSSLFYVNRSNLETYEELHSDRLMIARKIADYYRKRIPVQPAPRGRKRIAVITSQMLSYEHAPTQLAINYVKHLLASDPEFQVKIFVDDIFSYSMDELILPAFFYSTWSVKGKEIHDRHLVPLGVGVHYSDAGKNRIDRLKEDVDAVQKFQPEVVWVIGNDFSLTREILYPYYPVLDMSIGMLANSPSADIYLGSKEAAAANADMNKYGVTDGTRYYWIHAGGDFPEPKQAMDRKDWGLSQDDFVMICVGNRIRSEITPEFADMILSFMESRPDVKWLIVGTEQQAYIDGKLSERMRGRIIYCRYEQDLAALYQLCDVYINPYRMHGGYSVGMAMNQSLPVLTLHEASDAFAFVGEQWAASDKQDYYYLLLRYYKNRSLRAWVGSQLQQRMKSELSIERSIPEITAYFEQAVARYAERTRNTDHKIFIP